MKLRKSVLILSLCLIPLIASCSLTNGRPQVDDNNGTDVPTAPEIPDVPTEDPFDKIFEIYKQAVAEGKTTLSYEEWLESIVGPQGPAGENGLSAYEIYIKYHPEYKGSEEEWINDLVNGNLATNKPDNPNTKFTVKVLDLNGVVIKTLILERGSLIPPQTLVSPTTGEISWYVKGKKWDFANDRVFEDIDLIPLENKNLGIRIAFGYSENKILKKYIDIFNSSREASGLTTINPTFEDISYDLDINKEADIYWLDAVDYYRHVKNYKTPKLNSETTSYIENKLTPSASLDMKEFGDMVFYPTSSTPGMVLYYNKRYLNLDDTKYLDTILEKATTLDKYFYFPLDTAYFAIGTMFTFGADYSYVDDGEKLNYNANFNSTAGLKAGRLISDILAHNKNNSRCPQTELEAQEYLAVVDGPWNYKNYKKIFGEDLGVVSLPSVLDNGVETKISSFKNFKGYAVNHTSSSAKQEVSHAFLRFMLDLAPQKDYFNELSYLPVTLESINDLRLQNNDFGKALLDQSKYSRLELNIPPTIWGSYDQLVNKIKDNIYRNNLTDDVLRNLLSDFNNSIEGC